MSAPPIRLPAGTAFLLVVGLAAACAAPGDASTPPGRAWTRQGGAVLRAPQPSAPLRERWEWAEREAERRGRGGYWVGFGIRRPMLPGEVVIDGSHGIDLEELHAPRAPLARVLEGREVSEPPAPGGRVLKEVAILLHFAAPGRGAAGVDRIAVSNLSVGMELGGSPVFWLGPADDAESIPLLREMVPGLRGEEMQGAGVEAVAIHARSDLVVPFLAATLRGRMGDRVRGDAAEGLARHPGAEALGLLVEAARGDRSVEVQGEAAETLGELDHPGATAALRGLVLSDLPVEVRMEAAEALGDRPAAEAAPVLEEVVRRAAPAEVRGEAVEALGGFPDEVSLPRLARLAWEGASPDVQREAVETLGERPTGRVLPELERIIARHPLPEVQAEAVEALGDLHRRSVEQRDGQARAVLATLERVARTHPDSRVRAEATEALGELRGGDDAPSGALPSPSHPGAR